MKVLFTHPYFWPYVRRGAERELHDAGVRLVRSGHEVRLLTSTPTGVHQQADIDGLKVRYVRTPLSPVGRHKGWDETSAFARPAFAALQLVKPDLVHAWHYPDGAAAVRASRGRFPVVLKLTGTVIPERILRRPVDGLLIKRAVEGADEVWCNSEFARSEMADFGVAMRIVPAGVDASVFHPAGNRSSEPTAFVASASDEPRKRLVDVVDGWPEVVALLPTATLRIAGHASAATRAELLDRIPETARASIHFLGLLDDVALVDEFSTAWCVLAPAVYEALGLVTIEAWACGTPVLGARSGATAELITHPGLGALVEPLDPQSWTEAMVTAMQSPPPPALEACVDASRPFHWERIMPVYEERYAALLGERR